MIAQINRHYIKTRPTKLVSRLLSYGLFEGRPLTTKGQWINPLISFLFEIEKRLPQIKSVKKPVFVVGTGRSGTTILGTVLSMHKDVGFLNEPKALWHSIYPFEDVIGSYTDEMTFYRLDETHVSAKNIEDAHRLFGAYLFLTGNSKVIDKYPELIFRVPFVKKIFPDAKFLFLVRNGWDTCHSIKKWSMRLGVNKKGQVHDWWGKDNKKWKILVEQIVKKDEYFKGSINAIENIQDHNDMAIVEWIATMREGLRLLEYCPADIHMVRFEDLTQNTPDCLSDIRVFCSLDKDNIFQSYAESVLTPVSPHQRFEINSSITPLFEDVMQQLGY